MTLDLDDLIEGRLTAADLVIALGWHLRLAKVENELARYWAQRLRLLSLAFGLSEDWARDGGSGSMVERLALAATAPGLFCGVLEYRPHAGETEVLEECYPAIGSAECELRSQAAACAVGLLGVRWPHLTDASVSAANLVQQGLPANVPDLIDFL